nr:MAG TPA: hypothetical protein [Caudoviricetes sp.]
MELNHYKRFIKIQWCQLAHYSPTKVTYIFLNRLK